MRGSAAMGAGARRGNRGPLVRWFLQTADSARPEKPWRERESAPGDRSARSSSFPLQTPTFLGVGPQEASFGGKRAVSAPAEGEAWRHGGEGGAGPAEFQ